MIKKLFDSIYFYPLLTFIIFLLGLSAFYSYTVNEIRETIIQQQLADTDNAAHLLESIVEEFSFAKKRNAIEREVTRLSAQRDVQYVLLTNRQGRILYANRYHYAGKN
jgi:hypothetical protein